MSNLKSSAETKPSFLARPRVGVSVIALMGAMLTSSVGYAQALDGDAKRKDEGEIIVTAERRAANILKTPLSVSAVGLELIQNAHVETLQGLSGKVPGVNMPTNYPHAFPVYIRGIGTADIGVPPAVGVYIDDVFVPRGFGNGLLDLPDIERIEVLRGPQGTLYGQNTSAGAVKIVSRDPGNALTGSLLIEGGNYDAFRTQIYLAGPIIPDKLSASIAFTHRERDGYTYNPAIGRSVDALNTEQARIKLHFTPTDDFDAMLSVDYMSVRSDNGSFVPLNYEYQGPRRTYGDETFLHEDGRGALLRLTGRINDHLTIKSISGYRKVQDLRANLDIDGTPAHLLGQDQPLKTEQYSQEIQLLGDIGRLSYTAGATYIHENFDRRRFNWNAQRRTEFENHLRVRSVGFYAQFNYNVTDALRLTAGGRYNHESQKFTGSGYIVDDNNQRISQNYYVSDLRHSQNSFTPKLAVDYQVLPELLGYASWTRGYKSGGFNTASASTQVAGVQVGPERVDAYEIGAKGSLFGGVLQASAAVFYNDFKGYQALITTPTINGQVVNGNILLNAGKAHTYGAELETTLSPGQGFKWHNAVTFLKTKFDSFLNPSGASASDFSGNLLPYAPEWSIGSSIDYILPFSLAGEVGLYAAVDYKSSAFYDVANTVATKIDAQTYVNLGVNYKPEGSGLEFQVLARNIFNKAYSVSPHTLVPVLGINSLTYSAPRFVTASVKYKF